MVEDLNDVRLISLVRSSLLAVDIDVSLFTSMDEADWKQLYKQAQSQGVVAIVCDGIQLLPASCRPPENLFLQWIVAVNRMEKRYQAQCSAAISLQSLYAQNGIKMLIVKGIGISLYYPVPSHRECGDIDIWLFGEESKGNKVIREQGIKIHHEKEHSSKHTSFAYHGVCIENHRRLLDVQSIFKSNIPYERMFFSYIDKDGLRTKDYDGVTLSFPPVMFDAFYLMAHISGHVIGRRGIALRFLCDWTIFLYRNHEQIDFEILEQWFEKTDRLIFAKAFTQIAVTNLCLPKECAGTLYSSEYSVKEAALAESVLENRILHPKYRAVSGKNPMEILLQKIKRVGVNQKIYQQLFGLSFARRYALGAYWDRLTHIGKLFLTPHN